MTTPDWLEDTAVVGIATLAGTLGGGVLGGAVLGGVASAGVALYRGGDVYDAASAFGMGFAGGLVGGAVFGWGSRAIGGLFRSTAVAEARAGVEAIKKEVGDSALDVAFARGQAASIQNTAAREAAEAGATQESLLSGLGRRLFGGTAKAADDAGATVADDAAANLNRLQARHAGLQEKLKAAQNALDEAGGNGAWPFLQRVAALNSTATIGRSGHVATVLGTQFGRLGPHPTGYSSGAPDSGPTGGPIGGAKDVPVRRVELSRTGLPDLQIPDNRQLVGPLAHLQYPQAVESWLAGEPPEGSNGLPPFIVGTWDSFGDPERATDMPTTSTFPDIPPTQLGAGFSEPKYRQRLAAVNAALADFRQVEQQVAALAAQSRVTSRRGKLGVIEMVGHFNDQAKTRPEPHSETEHIMKYVAEGIKVGERALLEAEAKHRDTADGIRNLERRTADGRELIEGLNKNGLPGQQRTNTTDLAMTGQPRAMPERNRPNPEYAQLQQLLKRIDNSLDRRPARNPQVAPLQNPAALQPPTTQQPDLANLMRGLPGAMGGLGGFGGLGGLNPGLLGGASRDDRLRDDIRDQRRELREAQRDLRDRERELRDQRLGPNAAPRPMAVAASPAPQPPPPRLDAEGRVVAQPAKDEAAQGAPPARTPDEDGKVLYTFEDGRQQRVWPAVADALDVALADNAGTNAQAAYENTPAKWDDDKEIGNRVDPAELQTGDICAFEKTEALAVVWGSPDSGGSLELVVNGRLVPFDPESKEFASLGSFVGFMHPLIDPGAAGGGVQGTAIASTSSDHQAVAVPVG